MRIDTRNLSWLLAAAGLLWGCGSQDSTAPSRPAPPRPASAVDARSRNMVSAVADAKGGPVPVQVRYELKQRPEPAQPLDVELAILPVSGSVDRIVGRVETDDGLDLAQGAQIPPADRPAEGVAIRHALRVVPRREGIFTVRAVVTVDSGGQSVSETFSIPVIAAAEPPDDAPTSAPDASGSRAAPGH